MKNNCSLIKKFCNKLNLNIKHKKVCKEDVDFFNKVLSPKAVMSTFNNKSLTEQDFLYFNQDYNKIYKGNSNTVLFPSTTEQVSSILKYCNENLIQVVPQSGNTGLIGGSSPINNEIVLHMGKFNKIKHWDELSSCLTLEAGCVLEQVNEYLLEKNHCAPVDLGSKGSCMIGGNISTNAGGIHFIKFGSLRSNVRGLKVVVANGEILDFMNPLPKNNTGYDLKHLFIGSEGTLGVITECILKCHRIPNFKKTCLLKISNFNEVLDLVKKINELFSEKIFALEFFDQDSLEIQLRNGFNDPFNNAKQPDLFNLENRSLYVLVEIGNSTDFSEAWDSFIESLNIIDGVFPNDQQLKDIWSLRETILEGGLKFGPTICYDVSLELSKFYDLVEKMRKFCYSEKFLIQGFGHIGDFNLHINLTDSLEKKPDRLNKYKPIFEQEMFSYIKKVGGSISAEHGIGRQKKNYLNFSKDQNVIEMMKLIKNSYDKNQILNPYKMF